MKMIMTILIMMVIISYIVLAVGVYTPPDSHEIDLVLEKDYTAPDSHNVPLVLPPTTPAVGQITYITYGSPIDLNPGTTKTIYFIYDVTDASDINETSAEVTVTYSTESRTSESPCDYSISDDTMTINCTVIHYYYDSDGSWSINASVRDDNNVLIQDITETYTINSLDDILFNTSDISCGTINSPSDDNKCDVLKIENRGNQNYTVLNETGYDLDDDTTSTYLIEASQFDVSATDVAEGDSLSDGTPVTITDAELPKGESSTEILYTYVDIPTSKPSDSYTSIQDWVIEAK